MDDSSDMAWLNLYYKERRGLQTHHRQMQAELEEARGSPEHHGEVARLMHCIQSNQERISALSYLINTICVELTIQGPNLPS